MAFTNTSTIDNYFRKHNEYAKEVETQLKTLGIRIKVDYSDHTIGKK